jgi:serine/threonine-protein kinase
VGQSLANAQSLLAAAHLKANVHEVFSDRPSNTVVAQDPAAGQKVVQNTSVRINVSKGAPPVGVPPVVGQSFDSASGELQAAGFAVARRDVESNQAAGTVVDQNPAANTLQPKGSTVTLGVSKGPKVTTVPDVTGLDQDSALATLENAGFRTSVSRQLTTDAAQDGIVLDQTPFGGGQAKPGSTVVIVVGKLQTTTTTRTTTTPTTTGATTGTTTTTTTSTPRPLPRPPAPAPPPPPSPSPSSP